MVWLVISHIFSAILELLRIGHLSDKDLEIMILRHQLDVMTRLQTKPVKPNRAEKLTLACDFFTVETVFLRTIYVLIFIELGTRRVHLAGITSHPDGFWAAQQARQLIWEFEEKDSSFLCLIRDNDKKFTEAFYTVFESSNIHIIPTSIKAPNANAYSERWVRTVRQECLDHLLIVNESHLRRVLREFLAYYNARRPHQGLEQESPIPRTNPVETGIVNRHRQRSIARSQFLHTTGADLRNGICCWLVNVNLI